MPDNPPAAPSEPGALVGWRRGVDRVYCYLVGLFVLGVLAQVFLAGVGVFGDHASKVANASSFDPHRALGSVLGIVAVVLFLVALAARASRSTVIGALVLAVLTLAAQPALANAGDSNKWSGGFHALDGMLILLISVWLAVAAFRREMARRQAVRPTPAPVN
jgi:Mn2+/Fe2+ NRAMP family transporter